MNKTKNVADIPSSARIVDEVITIVDGKKESEFIYYEDGDLEVLRIPDHAKIIAEDLASAKKASNIKIGIIKIKITSTKNNEFDCDEISQQRIARKIIIMDDTEKVDWKLSDNTIVKVDKEELIEVLKYAMVEQEMIQLEL